MTADAKVGLLLGLFFIVIIAFLVIISLPDLITSLRYQPEFWTAEEPLLYDENQIGLKGSPTWVAQSGTPEAHEPAETISVAEKGLQDAVSQALKDMLSNKSVASIMEEIK